MQYTNAASNLILVPSVLLCHQLLPQLVSVRLVYRKIVTVVFDVLHGPVWVAAYQLRNPIFQQRMQFESCSMDKVRNLSSVKT